MQNLWPVLLLLACPLVMIFMMRGMHGGGHPGPSQHDRLHDVPDERDQRIAELEHRVAELSKDRAESADRSGP